jgi:hypothetical protein
MSVSLDGYVASPDGSTDWLAAGRSDDSTGWVLETVSNAGAHVIGAATERPAAMDSAHLMARAEAFALPLSTTRRQRGGRRLTNRRRTVRGRCQRFGSSSAPQTAHPAAKGVTRSPHWGQ